MTMSTRILTLYGCLAVLAACGEDAAPPRSVPTPQTTIATATPYAQPPAVTIVDASGRIAGAAAGAATGTREVTYEVESGDTLIAIAARFDTTLEAIMRRNNITNPAELRVGQRLTIPMSASVVGAVTPTATAAPTPSPTAAPGPTATPIATARPSPAPATTPGATTQVYVVAEGDNAFTIAGRYGVTVEELAQANNRTVASLANLQIGDRLLIPPSR
jgi:LysM repeat protein